MTDAISFFDTILLLLLFLSSVFTSSGVEDGKYPLKSPDESEVILKGFSNDQIFFAGSNLDVSFSPFISCTCIFLSLSIFDILPSLGSF